jgi:hypothetical protein
VGEGSVVPRHPRLAPLSRQHHVALVEGRALRDLDPGAAAEQRRAAVERFLAFWRREGAIHFRTEEEVLLPWYARWGDLEHPAVVRMLLDHAAIRGAVLGLGAASAAELRALGARLMAHVRLEEDEVFPLIEATVPAEVLAAVEGIEEAGPGCRPSNP